MRSNPSGPQRPRVRWPEALAIVLLCACGTSAEKSAFRCEVTGTSFLGSCSPRPEPHPVFTLSAYDLNDALDMCGECDWFGCRKCCTCAPD